MKSTEHLLGLPLVAALAIYDEMTQASANNVYKGIEDFLYIADAHQPDDMLFSPEKIAAAKDLFGRMKGFAIVRQKVNKKNKNGGMVDLLSLLDDEIDFDLEGINPRLWGGLMVPLLGAVQTEAERQGKDPGAYLTSELAGKEFTSLLGFLDNTGVIAAGKLGRPGKLLLKRVALGGYTQLAYSYLPYFINLDVILEEPAKCGFDKQIDRWQPENAEASNKLISNIIATLVKSTPAEDVNKILDFGSGGGYLLLAMANRDLQVAGIDLNQKANKAALDLLTKSGREGELLLGNLMKESDLLWAAEKVQPDVTFISYILHDIAGFGEDKTAGMEIVREFLENYRNVFTGVPLYISEVYDTPRDILKAEANVGAIMFSLLHAISPQHLFGRDDLLGLLEETGFEAANELVHTKHKDESLSNSTIIAVPK